MMDSRQGAFRLTTTLRAAFKRPITGKHCGSVCLNCRLTDITPSCCAPCSSPGVAFSGDHRAAYLPDNTEGLLLLKRLEYAFSRGLSFSVGTSITRNKADVVTWSSIHHRTSPSGGAFSFPDPNYFHNCNEELDALGVPPADAL